MRICQEKRLYLELMSASVRCPLQREGALFWKILTIRPCLLESEYGSYLH